MDSIYSNIFSEFISHGWIYAALAVLLLAYKFASKRVRFLPTLPVGLLLVYLVLKVIHEILPSGEDPRLHQALDIASATVLYCAIVRIAFFVFVESWYWWRKRTAMPGITRDLVLIVSYVVITIITLRVRGINPLGLITTSAILTAVVGFAAQNALGNLFAGLSLQVEKPFHIGDWLQLGEHVGKVVHVGWESTRLLTFDDETVIIPNLDISKSVIKNHSLPTIRHAMKIDIGVEYGAPPNSVRKILLDICRQEPAILAVPPPVVRVTNYGDFAINYQLRLFYNDFETSADVRAAIMNRIWYAFKRHDIKIPFPVRDVAHRHIERRALAAEQHRMRADAEAMFVNVPILAPLSPEARQGIAKQMMVEEYGDGEIVVKQGDAGDSLYIIHKGACDIEISMNERSSKVATLAPPAFFGEMSLLTGEPRSATVRACGDITVFSIGKEIFKDVIASHPGISEELARVLAKRHAETDGAASKQKEEEDHNTSKLLNRIRTFFAIST